MEIVQELAARSVAAVLDGRSLRSTLAFLWQRHGSLTESQRGAIQDLAYGTLRELGRFRGILGHMVARVPTDPLLQALLWVALYQLGRTRAASYAVVDNAVNTSARLVSPAVRGFVNALLRRYLRECATLDRLACNTDEGRYSYPKWWIDMVRHEYPLNWRSLLESGNTRPPMTLRVNRRRADPCSYVAHLKDRDMPAHRIGDAGVLLEKPVTVARLPGFAEGWVSIQDAGAQWVPHLLDLRDGQRVLDACAAPGGKTAHMLESSAIDLTAIDVDAGRMQQVHENLARLGLAARTRCADAARPDSWWDGASFDRILADVPCSASGVVRRHPDIKWLRRAQDLPVLSQRQRELINALWKVLAPGGKLLYVTCSVFKQENDEEILDFLSHRHDAERLPLDSFPETHGQLLPGPEYDGFYYALLRKRRET